MKFIILVIILSVFTSCGIENNNTKKDNNSNHVDKNITNMNAKKEYLKYFNGIDGKNSDIVTSCINDSDCKLVSISKPCGGFSSINSVNTINKIENFNKIQSEILKDFNFDCMVGKSRDNFIPICNNNICTSKVKKKFIIF